MGWKWGIPDDIPGKDKKPPKPYTVPEGWKPPSLNELFQYAAKRHPYYRYGYALVFITGIIGFTLSYNNKKTIKKY